MIIQPIDCMKTGLLNLSKAKYLNAVNFINSAISRNTMLAIPSDILFQEYGGRLCFFSDAMNNNPQWSWLGVNYCYCLIQNGDIDKAKNEFFKILNKTLLFERHSSLYVGDLLIHQLLKGVSKDDIVKAAQLILEEFCKLPYRLNHNINLLNGIIAYQLGDFKEAEYFFRSLSLGLDPIRLSHATLGANSYRAIIRKSKADSICISNLYEMGGFYKDDSKLCITASCDENYLNKFGSLYINSCAKYNPKVRIWINIVAKNAPNITTILNDLKIKKDIPLLLTWMVDIYKTKSFYATSRFFLLASPKAQSMIFRNGILLTDIDMCFQKPIKFSSIYSDKILLKFKNKDIHVPWKIITAGCLYFPWDNKAKKFIIDIKKYFIFVHQDNDIKKEIWWVDQNAINYCYSNSSDKSIFGYLPNLDTSFALNSEEEKDSFLLKYNLDK